MHHRKPEPKGTFRLENAAWPNLSGDSALPPHVVKVCAVALHRDELEFPANELGYGDWISKIPGHEFSGYVVSAHPDSPLPPGTEV
jgi:hypothetical protein